MEGGQAREWAAVNTRQAPAPSLPVVCHSPQAIWPYAQSRARSAPPRPDRSRLVPLTEPALPRPPPPPAPHKHFPPPCPHPTPARQVAKKNETMAYVGINKNKICIGESGARPRCTMTVLSLQGDCAPGRLLGCSVPRRTPAREAPLAPTGGGGGGAARAGPACQQAPARPGPPPLDCSIVGCRPPCTVSSRSLLQPRPPPGSRPSPLQRKHQHCVMP